MCRALRAVLVGGLSIAGACERDRPTAPPLVSLDDLSGSSGLVPIVRDLAAQRGIGELTRPAAVRPELVRLGQALFFDKVLSGNRDIALVVDDMVSFDPFIARGIRVYGRAANPVQRTGLVGPGFYLPITPTISWSWNMEAQPVGEAWYPARRADHPPTPGASAGD